MKLLVDAPSEVSALITDAYALNIVEGENYTPFKEDVELVVTTVPDGDYAESIAPLIPLKDKFDAFCAISFGAKLPAKTMQLADLFARAMKPVYIELECWGENNVLWTVGKAISEYSTDNPRLVLDLDAVVFDTVSHMEALGYIKWPVNEWDDVSLDDFRKYWYFSYDTPLIESFKEYWPMLIAKFRSNIIFLSNRPRFIYEWTRRALSINLDIPEHEINLIFSGAKEQHLTPNDIVIDDYPNQSMLGAATVLIPPRNWNASDYENDYALYEYLRRMD